jgi:hypothetical protein
VQNLFETYKSLWPVTSHEQLMPLLKPIDVVHYPGDLALMATVKRPAQTVVVTEGAKIRDIVDMCSKGFEHFVQRTRPDFPQELLVSGLMAVRPMVFSENPVPFFFTGFQTPQSTKDVNANIVLPFGSSKKKTLVLDRLHTFLGQEPGLTRIRDLCIQSADELITNALFSAPVLSNGQKMFQTAARGTEVTMPDKKEATLFATFSKGKVVIGCTDPFGSMVRGEMLIHLRNVFRRDKVELKTDDIGGAGFGMKYIIENAANFYIYVEKGKRSLVASAFNTGSMKANLSEERHFHFSFS